MNSNILKLSSLLFISFLLFSCNNSDDSKKSGNRTTEIPKKVKNTEKVNELLKSLASGQEKPLEYINKNSYIQHSPYIEDGFQGFNKFFQSLKTNNIQNKNFTITRIFEDGNYVFAHSESNLTSNDKNIGFNIFRFDQEGKIVEHWDNNELFRQSNKHQNTMINGSTTIEDLNNTALNKTLVENYINKVFKEKNINILSDYLDPNLIQHNPDLETGIAGIANFMNPYINNSLQFDYEIKKILGNGNFILAILDIKLADEKMVLYSLYRIKNNKIAEQWDVIENHVNRTNWKNTNNKFDFK